MREKRCLFDDYITFGVSEESRDDKKMHEDLKTAADTLNRCIESLKISQTFAKTAGADGAQF